MGPKDPMPMALSLPPPASRRNAMAAAMVDSGSPVGMRTVRRSPGPVPAPQMNLVPPASMAPNNVILQEAQAVEGDGIGRLLDIAPDSGRGADIADVEAKTFDGQPAVVAHVAQSLKDALPVGMAAAGNAAVVFARVDMAEMPRHGANAGGDILLFDVGVEGVEQNADIGVIDFVAKARGIHGRIEEISFEAIQLLDRQRDAIGGERIADRLQTFDRPLPFIAGAASSGEIADRTVHGAGENFRARIGRRPDQVFQMLEGGGPFGGVIAHGAHALQERGGDGGFEAVGLQVAANGGGIEAFEAEQRKFNPIETCLFDPREKVADRLIVLPRPDHRIHAEFHQRDYTG